MTSSEKQSSKKKMMKHNIKDKSKSEQAAIQRDRMAALWAQTIKNGACLKKINNKLNNLAPENRQDMQQRIDKYLRITKRKVNTQRVNINTRHRARK